MLSKKEMYRYAGDLSQLFYARQYRLGGGRADGMRAVDVKDVYKRQPVYDMEKTKPTEQIMMQLYPEIYSCIGCNACTKACTQELKVMQYIACLLYTSRCV